MKRLAFAGLTLVACGTLVLAWEGASLSVRVDCASHQLQVVGHDSPSHDFAHTGHGTLLFTGPSEFSASWSWDQSGNPEQQVIATVDTSGRPLGDYTVSLAEDSSISARFTLASCNEGPGAVVASPLPPAVTPTPTATPTATPTPTPTPTAAPTTAPTATPTGGVSGGGAGAGGGAVSAAGASQPTGGVEAATLTAPNTGSPVPFALGLALLSLGLGLLAAALWPRVRRAGQT